MEDRKRKLEELARKRDGAPTIPKPKANKASESEKGAKAKEAFFEKREKELERKGVKLDEYEKDGFVVGSDEEEEEAVESSEEEDSLSSNSDDGKHRKKKKLKPLSDHKKKDKHKKKKRSSDSESDNDSDANGGEDVDTEDELEGLDPSAIISTGRRTRGKRIDYKQFGLDKPEDEE